ncbi:MAG TPA: BsaWI family type II restriction enzyme [Anaeromyxobacteraceae bacterium]|nr:BsaWI family type II restriction enzyme [Anaeromyxobacteraceae bacterium]
MSKTKIPKARLDPADRARANRQKRLAELRKRERLAPALAVYDEQIARLRSSGHSTPELEALGSITGIFLEGYGVVQSQIAAAGKTGINATNAVKRSAGTNYQGLVEYGIICWIDTTNLPLNVRCNAPKAMRDELTIHGVDASGGTFSVEPDIDVCIWEEDGPPKGPLLFLSAKTSLVDRAGQAARWKLYLDMHQTTCPHTKIVADCPIYRTRILVKTSHPIVHAITTANIYKMFSTQPEGELRSGQCRNNTYMFRHKYTTRSDAQEYRPADWVGLREITVLVQQTFAPVVAPPMPVSPVVVTPLRGPVDAVLVPLAAESGPQPASTNGTQLALVPSDK